MGQKKGLQKWAQIILGRFDEGTKKGEYKGKERGKQGNEWLKRGLKKWTKIKSD